MHCKCSVQWTIGPLCRHTTSWTMGYTGLAAISKRANGTDHCKHRRSSKWIVCLPSKWQKIITWSASRSDRNGRRDCIEHCGLIPHTRTRTHTNREILQQTRIKAWIKGYGRTDIGIIFNQTIIYGMERLGKSKSNLAGKQIENINWEIENADGLTNQSGIFFHSVRYLRYYYLLNIYLFI